MKRKKTGKSAASTGAAKRVSGVRGLAAALGVSAKTATKYINDSLWKLGRGPWTPQQVTEAKSWREKHYPDEQSTTVVADDEDNSDEEALIAKLPIDRRARTRQIIERTAAIKLEREMQLGGYVKKEDVERGRLERIQAVTAALKNLRLLARNLIGLDQIAMEDVLEGWARGVCRKFATND